MRTDVSALIYRLPAPLREMVVREVKRLKEPEAQTAHITSRYDGLLSATVDADAYLVDQKARRDHAARSRGLRRRRLRTSARAASARPRPCAA
jgi:hypothetical protein